MSTRHAGWVEHFLKDFAPIQNTAEYATSSINSINSIRGFSNKLMVQLCILNEYHLHRSFSSKMSSMLLFQKDNNFFFKSILPNNYNATYIKYLHWLKLLINRHYRANMTANLQAAYGQSSWHNNNTVKVCNYFLHIFCCTFEWDLFKKKQAKVFRYTKLHEMRMKANMRNKKKVKKFTKFKRFGERRMFMKRKRSPWD